MSIQHISALARGLKQADPHDQRVRTASLARIDELRKLLDRAGCSELVCCLDAAGTLTRMTMDEEGPSSSGLMEVVAKLVEAVDASFQYESPHVEKVKAMDDTGLNLVGPADGAEETQATEAPAPPAITQEKQSGFGDGSLSLAGMDPVALPKSATRPSGSSAQPPPRRAVATTDQPDGALPMLNDMILGELMIQLGHITREQLNEGLDHQAAKGGRLGQALIDNDVTSWDVIDNVLRFQRMLNPEHGSSDAPDDTKDSEPAAHREMPTLLGEVVVHLGFAEEQKVEEALRVHKATGIRMGEALVQIDALTWPQLRESLRVQHNMRYAAGHAEVSSPKFGLPSAGKVSSLHKRLG